ncbi:PITSLRE serine/threonine-protein kinase CDC2L1 [Balamuthia mandrillaris]
MERREREEQAREEQARREREERLAREEEARKAQEASPSQVRRAGGAAIPAGGEGVPDEVVVPVKNKSPVPPRRKMENFPDEAASSSSLAVSEGGAGVCPACVLF